MQDIIIKGAKTHNLKNIEVTIPKGKLIVVTGVSGSGKSSLSIDTLYAEGQRRYIESLSSYARQFLSRMNKPDVEYIKGLCPAIALEQKVAGGNNRSTVGTLTEIYDYLRLLYARIGITYSPKSGNKVKKDDISDVIDFIQKTEVGKTFFIGFEIKKQKNTEEQLKILLSKGFNRLYVENNFKKIEDFIESEIDWKKAFVVVQRFKTPSQFEEEFNNQLADSIQTAYEENHYELVIYDTENSKIQLFNNKFECDGISFEMPTPQFFNFNNSYGACSSCEGMGMVLGIEEDLVIPDKSRSFYEGCVVAWRSERMKEYYFQFLKYAEKNKFPIHRPYFDLTEKEKNLLWKGNKNVKGIEDFFKMIKENNYKMEYRILYSRYRGRTKCPDCEGKRIRKDSQYVKINNTNISELLDLQIIDLKRWFENLKLSETENQIAKRILIEINNRLEYMLNVGLGYLTLGRYANTLSGGESQRIQLTRTLGSNLTDSLYILDEPSIGLHPKDSSKLINVLKKLRDLGNTVLVVEHEEEIMKASDYIIDMGPLAGVLGGEVVFAGEYKDINSAKTLTALFLNKTNEVKREKWFSQHFHFVGIEGAKHHNLKKIDVKFPLHAITVVSGVSGSGKTTLIKKILYPAFMEKIGSFVEKSGDYSRLIGDVKKIHHVEMIDQNPLGRSSRSNPVTYVKAFDGIRDLFSNLKESKTKGLEPKDFSFNVAGGRCENCKGDGTTTISMQFLADVELVCEDCKGKRYQPHVLEVAYKNKNINDILEMTVDEAVDFFKENYTIYDKIKPLQDIGLGYIKLGQSSSTLSGGEAQRVKLASYLNPKSNISNHLFIFDEPTTGLHFYDVQKLLYAMERLVEKGHSVLIIEHNMDIIKNADWIIDLGPEGGDQGGELIFEGTLSDFKKCTKGHTAKFLS